MKTVQISRSGYKGVWQCLLARLDEWHPNWRDRTGLEQPRRVADPTDLLKALSNQTVFEAFAVALLSGNTRWDRIERVRGALHEPFCAFQPEAFSQLDEAEIVNDVLP